ncbi:unnamed protein product [Amoebophrya sp. A120]|nr:unnamed protein product [Amoebophrya sp. A120]|eukprot:GSA120T00007716001.1
MAQQVPEPSSPSGMWTPKGSGKMSPPGGGSKSPPLGGTFSPRSDRKPFMKPTYIYDDIRVPDGYAQGSNEHPLETFWTFWYDQGGARNKAKKKKNKRDHSLSPTLHATSSSATAETTTGSEKRLSAAEKEQLTTKGEVESPEDSEESVPISPKTLGEEKNDKEMFLTQLKELCTVGTVEEFTRCLAYLKGPNQLPKNKNVYLFRKGFIPAWEHHPDGGCWIIRVAKDWTAVDALNSKKKKNPKVEPKLPPEPSKVAEKMWIRLLLCAIGEEWNLPDVVGIVLSTRGGTDALSVWNKTAGLKMVVGDRLTYTLELPDTTLLQYKEHKKSLQDLSTFRNAEEFVFLPP